ncbi:MAG TPA: PD-(D/E)XK nuclease family protein [Thermoleophilia bacterium]|nr:PD-(D/E)XK nuclease family protein [Thermoleophilia bacterium]
MTAGPEEDRGRLVTGRFSELEGALVARVAELRGGRSLAPLTIVVGSAALRSRVDDLLIRGLRAIGNVSVVTLSGLATGLVTRATREPPHLLAPLARERLVRRCVATRGAQEGLRYFGPVSERPHFARAMAATFEDLRQACLDPRGGWAGGAAHGKATDLEALYAAYCAELEGLGAADDAAIHAAAVAALIGGATRTTAAAKTILYGIYDLNEVQGSLVSALLLAGADLFVPWPRAGGDQDAPVLQAAYAAGLAEERLAPPEATSDLDRVAAALAAGHGGTAGALSLIGDGSFAVVSVSDDHSEAREAAREVLSAASRTGFGAAFWDCAILVPRAEDVERFAVGLESAGLPVACRRPDRSLGVRVLQRFLDCLAPTAGKPFSRRAVLDLFTIAVSPGAAGSTPLSGPELWADEARMAGVVSGLGQWTERVSRRRRGLERRLAELTTAGDQAELDDAEGGERLEHVRRRLAAAGGLETAVIALERACAGLPERAGWGHWAESLAAVAKTAFAAEIADGVGDAAGRLRSLDVVREEVGVAEMAGALREQLAGARVSSGRVGRDGVAILTPLDLRGLRFHTIVFTGMAEGGYPSRGRPDPIFGDGQRRLLSETHGVRLPMAEARDVESLLLFALACEAARERLVLLAPRTDAATGRPRLPSRLLLRLASRAAGRSVGLDEFLSGAPLGGVWRRVSGRNGGADDPCAVWVAPRERDVAVLSNLGATGASAASGYLSALVADPQAVTRRLAAWSAWREEAPGAWDGLLGAAACEALVARDLFGGEVAPTRLERYISCPFKYLLRDVLGLFVPEEPDDNLEIDPLAFGVLVHRILQRAYEEVIAGDLGLADALAAVEGAHAACCAAAESRGVTGAELSWEARRGALLEDLQESVRLDPVFHRDGGHPVCVEWSFGEAVGRPVGLALPDGREVRFVGRVDRVDATEDGARVIDYKSGKGDVEKQRLKDGLSVQLPVYGLAARRAGDLVPDGDDAVVACLYRMVTRRGAFRDVPLTSSREEADGRLKILVAGVVGLVEAGIFARSTGGSCDHCDVKYACGSSAWTRARKRRHEALAPLVALQSRPAQGAASEADESGAHDEG